MIVLSKYFGGSVMGLVLVISLFAWRGIARLDGLRDALDPRMRL